MTESDENQDLSSRGLRMFYGDTEFYAIENNAPLNAQKPIVKGGNEVKYYGKYTSSFLMLFFYHGELQKAPFWEMVKRLIENPRAMNRKEEDFAIVNLAEQPGLTLESVVSELRPELCLVWGQKAAGDIGLHMYEVHQLNGYRLLMVDDPERVQESRELKDQLWINIQKIL